MSPRGAVHNALSRGTLPAALSRAVGDMEGAAGLERYGETLTPTLNLWDRPEWAYLRKELLMSDDVSQAAVAGEFGIIALMNPVDSGVIAVVESVRAWASVQQFFSLARDTFAVIAGTLAFTERGQARDCRGGFGLNAQGRLQIYQGSDAGLGGARYERITTQSGGGNYGEFRTALPFILTPGWGLMVQSGLVNILIEASFGWRERAAFPGELE